ncbi:transmembrane protein 17B-like [Pomacea canaliculata]|uniref:transmembrane protein 17B-like n=1 Tax=Pomacea canaliculata TaxID=400727 RepID=UPI000D735AE1|nr:transmembrane protein 17B-like [Pomacea canaliculata]
MDATFRKTMTSVTDVLFPVNKSARDPQKHQILKTGNEYVTNLPLQMLIYFNAFFSPLWLITCIVMLEAKFNFLSDLYRIVLISVYIAYSLVEIIRLYLGYVGNLMERVPELAGFWLLTVLLQLPLILLLLFNTDALLLPLERAIHIVKALFVVSEVIVGYFAIRIMVNYQVTKYHLQQFTALDEVDNEYWPESRYTT